MTAGSRRELDSIVRWGIGVAQAEPERIKRMAAGTVDAATLQLPGRFWNRHITPR